MRVLAQSQRRFYLVETSPNMGVVVDVPEGKVSRELSLAAWESMGARRWVQAEEGSRTSRAALAMAEESAASKKNKSVKAEDCGTGAGGFKPGNDCAEGHGRPSKDDLRTRGPDVSEVSSVDSRKEFDRKLEEEGWAHGAQLLDDSDPRVAELIAGTRNSDSAHWMPDDMEKHFGITFDPSVHKEWDKMNPDERKVHDALHEYARSGDMLDFLRGSESQRSAYAQDVVDFPGLFRTAEDYQQMISDAPLLLHDDLNRYRPDAIPPERREQVTNWFKENGDQLRSLLDEHEQIMEHGTMQIPMYLQGPGSDHETWMKARKALREASNDIADLKSGKLDDQEMKLAISRVTGRLIGVDNRLAQKVFSTPYRVGLIKDAMLEFEKPITVYRGVHSLQRESNDLGKELLDRDSDARFRLEGFGSSTASPYVAMRFAQMNPESDSWESSSIPSIMKIKAKRGRPIGHSTTFAEAEILLPHDAEYRITDRYWAKIRGENTLIVECEEV